MNQRVLMMTKDDIIKLYEKANGWSPEGWDKTVNELERFANLVASFEREACAKLCEEEYNRVKQTEAAHYRQTPEPFFPQRFGFNMSRVRMSAELADAIRARGQE